MKLETYHDSVYARDLEFLLRKRQTSDSSLQFLKLGTRKWPNKNCIKKI